MPITAKYEKNSAFSLVAAAAIAEGDLVGINSSGLAVLADADAGTPIPAVGFAITAAASGASVGVSMIGTVRSVGSGLTIGATLYASGTAGGYTATAPSTATNIVQPVGIAITATDAVVIVSRNWSTVQAAGTTTRVPN